MAPKSAQARAWELARSQHWVVTRRQLLALGFTAEAIQHRIEKGRLHPLHSGVYAVGRGEVTEFGRWLAAVLACGRGAVLSHESAAALWGIRPSTGRLVEVSVPSPRAPRPRAIRVHRRVTLREVDTATREGIPVTSPICTIIDVAPRLTRTQLERAVNEADRLGLVDPERLSRGVEMCAGRRGVPAVRSLLDDPAFSLTDSVLEQRFLRIARRAGLPKPLTQRRVNGFRVDFYWPSLALVVETDGLRYHRTPAQQRRDRVRDQRHTAAGLTTLRFTHHQVAYETSHVERTLAAVRRNR